MRRKITRAKIGSYICSSATNPDGSPVWSLSKDGSFTISDKSLGKPPHASAVSV